MDNPHRAGSLRPVRCGSSGVSPRPPHRCASGREGTSRRRPGKNPRGGITRSLSPRRGEGRGEEGGAVVITEDSQKGDSVARQHGRGFSVSPINPPSRLIRPWLRVGWSDVAILPEFQSAGLTSGPSYDVVFAVLPLSPPDAIVMAWPERGPGRSAGKSSRRRRHGYPPAIRRLRNEESLRPRNEPA